MVMLADKDIEDGLVCHLTPKILRDDIRTETSAQWLDDVYDHSVDEDHYFLVLKQFDKQRWLCTPLFSRKTDARRILIEGEKSGFADKWKGVESFCNPRQQWLIPVSALIDASENEESPSDERRSYGRNARHLLRSMTMFIVDNQVPFHRPNPKPKVSILEQR